MENGARIINISYEADSAWAPFDLAVANACSHNDVVVISAGNYSTDDPGSDPLASDNSCAIRVAAVDPTNQLFYYSDYGSWVDVAATGQQNAVDGKVFGGTSAAAPVVSGIAGLILSYDPVLSSTQVKQLIMRTVTPAGLPIASGGIINAYNALNALGYVPPKWCDRPNSPTDRRVRSSRVKWCLQRNASRMRLSTIWFKDSSNGSVHRQAGYAARKNPRTRQHQSIQAKGRPQPHSYKLLAEKR